MITSGDIKAEIAKLTKQENMLRKQREAVQASLHGVIGALGNLRQLLKQSEECDSATPKEETPKAVEDHEMRTE